MLDNVDLKRFSNPLYVCGYHAGTSLDGTGFSIRFESIKCRYNFSVLLTSLSNPLLYDDKMDTRQEISTLLALYSSRFLPQRRNT